MAYLKPFRLYIMLTVSDEKPLESSVIFNCGPLIISQLLADMMTVIIIDLLDFACRLAARFGSSNVHVTVIV